MKRWNEDLEHTCNKAEIDTADSVETSTMSSSLKQYYTFLAEQSNRREGYLHEQDGYTCDVCKNRGIITKTEYFEDVGYWANVEHECVCMQVRRNIARLNRSGLKDVIGRYRFDTYYADEPWQDFVITMAQDYVAHYNEPGTGQSRWFFMGGQSGAGKSHICTAICREFLHSGKEVRYMLWRDESAKLKACVNDAAAYEKAIGELKQTDVLYIDDFFKCGQNENGTQKPTGADISLAFEILNYRYNNPHAITILSSESTLDEIIRIDEATGSRIGERAGKYSISLTGNEKNYRLKKMNKAG
ncbi:MAG: ATP-binding protein [Peptococcaceae bacterium]|nr:ATP-binding protein [Peptococcaceae bacterium]MBQ2448735.1 ATP-binding protein [Peptococcaceae bacterium]